MAKTKDHTLEDKYNELRDAINKEVKNNPDKSIEEILDQKLVN